MSTNCKEYYGFADLMNLQTISNYKMIDMDKIETRGGTRPGCGRKPAIQEKKRIQISISVSPETKRMIDEMRKRKVKVGQVVDELIRQYFEDEE